MPGVFCKAINFLKGNNTYQHLDRFSSIPPSPTSSLPGLGGNRWTQEAAFTPSPNPSYYLVPEGEQSSWDVLLLLLSWNWRLMILCNPWKEKSPLKCMQINNLLARCLSTSEHQWRQELLRGGWLTGRCWWDWVTLLLLMSNPINHIATGSPFSLTEQRENAEKLMGGTGA